MKAYTDLEQSKKLAEILQHESADMWYWEWPTAPQYNNYERPMPHKGEGIVNVPCWSLAALLEVLPCPSLDNTFGEWRCQCYKEDHHVATAYAGDPVDACVEMILKLHKEKML